MGSRKCCVGGCDATGETLFYFPKNDGLRKLWLSKLVPTNPLLSGLTKDQLLRKRVCKRHFDKSQFNSEGQRLRYSYPCLFTEAEMAHGEPLSTAEWNVLGEHNYCKNEDEEEDTTNLSLLFGRPDDPNFQEHSYSQSISSVTEHKEIATTAVAVAEQPGSSKNQIEPQLQFKDRDVVSHSFDQQMELQIPVVNREAATTAVAVAEQPGSSKNQIEPQVRFKDRDIVSHSFDQQMELQVPVVNRETATTAVAVAEQPGSSKNQIEPQVQFKDRGSCRRKIGSKKRKIIEDIVKLSAESLGDSATQRLAQAQSAANAHLLENFNLLNRQAKTFLMMQLRLVRKSKMTRRFSMEEKLMALLIMKQTPKGYKLLETMFALPSKRTLNRLAAGISIEPGLNAKIFEYISRTTKNWEEKKRICSIVFDEIALTPHLTFNENKDIIHGFVDVAGERKLAYCDHALVIMLRGVCSSWRQSVAYYFCEGTVSAAALKNILKQVVFEVVQTGLIPVALICDQGSTFRTAMKSFREQTVRLRSFQGLRDDGSVNISGQDISFFFDPPHLLKGIRNNFVTKDIVWEGKIASWKDIEFIYDLDSKLGHTRALPKLTAFHVDPKKMKKMKVSMATQVLSSRTAAMLYFTDALNKRNPYNSSSSTMSTTAQVVEFLDMLFDSVNGYAGGSKRGKLRRAIKENSPNIQFWKEAIEKLKLTYFKDTCSKHVIQTGKPRFVRVPSLQGWITTLESFLRLSDILFKKYGVDYYYPRNINQDPLENFFGRIRAVNYRNVNPDANTFNYSFKSLLMSNLLSSHSKLCNCEEDNGETLIDFNFLFEGKDNFNKENVSENVSSLPSSSSQKEHDVNLLNQVILEKIKVQCSAYTAGYICRKMSKFVKCASCLKTYTSPEEKIHEYMKFREYKSLKNSNLCYPSTRFLILYRDVSQLIHNYLNMFAHKNNVGSNLKNLILYKIKFAWIGCAKHSELLKVTFVKIIIRLQVHNWCNTINKILNGGFEGNYMSKNIPQKLAMKKYTTYRLRKRCLSK